MITVLLAPTTVSNLIFDKNDVQGTPDSSNLSGGARFTFISDALSVFDKIKEISAFKL